ncbi:hypothetical protein STHERM_c11680 [Spirochaeta thermophila DSM 6192]|uniref:Uncharacterized protein n=2 Tax=Winmispira thermophila TaxID=154 RepID=E0RSX3_WINT6|nr:hypothetical protein STHERM_c11680 [Spirochaeta thermophila DSM 6192]
MLLLEIICNEGYTRKGFSMKVRYVWLILVYVSSLFGEEVLTVGQVLERAEELVGREVLCEGVWMGFQGLRGALVSPDGVVPGVGMSGMGEWGRYRVVVYATPEGVVVNVVRWEATWPEVVTWAIWHVGGVVGFRDMVVLGANGEGYVVSGGAGWVRIETAVEARDVLEGVWKKVKGGVWGNAVADGVQVRVVQAGEEGRWWAPGLPGWLEEAHEVVETWAGAARRARWVEGWARERWGEGWVVEMMEAWWPDASLGWPEEGKFYAQVITPGWRVWIQHREGRRELRIPSRKGLPLVRSE